MLLALAGASLKIWEYGWVYVKTSIKRHAQITLSNGKPSTGCMRKRYYFYKSNPWYKAGWINGKDFLRATFLLRRQ